MYMMQGEPLGGKSLEQVQLFLRSCGLDYDKSIEFTALLMENERIVATGSLDGNTIKCVAVASDHQGEDLTARIMTALMQKAAEKGQKHLMLYTKPHNQYLFSPFGFYPVVRTNDCLVMENRRDGLRDYLAGIEKKEGKTVGCIVANCNPFTLGHRYLIESAAAQCDSVHVFILSENKGMFAPEERFRMAEAGCRDLKNVFLHPTGPYMVSAATFPTYFIKDKSRAGDIRCEADLKLFGEKIAPALYITRRYVGSEPECEVTKAYNEKMHEILPKYGVEVIEIPRCESQGKAVSASKARELIAQEEYDALHHLLPETTLQLIQMKKGN